MQKNIRTTKGTIALIKHLANLEETTETRLIEMAIMSYAVRKIGMEGVDKILDETYQVGG